MEAINKQQTGFKFGKYRLSVVKEFGQIKHDGRTYKLLGVRTHDDQDYLSLRLYNGKGKFIKQFLMEVALAKQIAYLLLNVPVLNVITGNFREE